MSINKDLSSIRVFSTENTEYFTQEIVKCLGKSDDKNCSDKPWVC